MCFSVERNYTEKLKPLAFVENTFDIVLLS